MEISAKTVKELRDKTGAGMMDCKKALKETNGDIEASVDFLRTKGILKAGKKTGRATREGQVISYIHPGGKIGVLIEVNCETDFAARTETFQGFVRSLAMQVAATSPMCVSRDDMPQETIDREMAIYRQQALESGKPEKILDKIAEGKLKKFYSENCLLEQSYIRDPDKTVEELIKEAISEIGENIIVARFSRFQLGEGARGGSEEKGEES